MDTHFEIVLRRPRRDSVLRMRVEEASNSRHAAPKRKRVIDRFIERSILENHDLKLGFDTLGLTSTNVVDASTIEALALETTALLRE